MYKDEPLIQTNYPEDAPQVELKHRNSSQQSEPTDSYGIASLIMAFLGVQLVGVILGFIGMKKAKEGGYSNILSKVGLILNLVIGLIIIAIFVPLFIFVFLSVQETSRDTLAITNVDLVSNTLELYHVDNGYYPADLKKLIPTGLDQEVLTEMNANERYRYIPSDCVIDDCASYLIEYDLEDNTITEVHRQHSFN